MTRLTREHQIAALEKDWAENPRWKGIKRGYSAADVVRLRGSVFFQSGDLLFTGEAGHVGS